MVGRSSGRDHAAPSRPREMNGGTVHPEQRAVLRELKEHLHSLGVANDAQDHGSVEEARRLRREAGAGIEGLLAKHVFLSELLPALRRRIETGEIFGGGWSALEDAVDAFLAATGGGRAQR